MKVVYRNNPRVKASRLWSLVRTVICLLIGVGLYQLVKGCESKACQIVGDCAEPPTVRKSALDTPGGLRFEERDSGRGSESVDPAQGNHRTPVRDSRLATATAKDAGSTPADRYPPFFAAIRAVESAGDDLAVGDGGRSSGPYQIGRAYWQDGGGKDYDRLVWNRAESERVMLGYFMRYEPEALANGDWETLARLHNGGPNWRQKLAATDGYWAKVNGQ